MNKLFICIAAGLTILFSSTTLHAHGAIQDPPARNWYCGAVTKPDHALYGTPEYPVCGEAFADDFNGGYQFMSVLTHAQGRKVVSPLPENVCGFNSESFGYGATPWDKAVDWPTAAMSSGRNKITWNISWGPHFSDTDEFVYWITKPGFDFQVGRALTWDDFESQPFCELKYSDDNPSASPDVVAKKAEQQFDTYCTIPQRSGRHVIYGEWGRNHYTFERFHSCIDARFSGGTNPTPTVTARISGAGNNQFIGTGAITLSANGSTGEGLDYQWTVNSATPELHALSTNDRSTTVLSLAQPSSSTSVTVTLNVSGAGGTDSTSITINHEPEGIEQAMWEDLGPLPRGGENLNSGDNLSLRVVLDNGEDLFYPSQPMTLSSANAAARHWPYALSAAVQAETRNFAVGVLTANGIVASGDDPASNRIYARTLSNASSAFVIIDSTQPPAPPGPNPEPPPANGDCRVTVRDNSNAWWAGFDVATNSDTVTLDFSGTGIDISRVRPRQGTFSSISTNGQRMTLNTPDWMSTSAPGYLDMFADNYTAMASMAAPVCVNATDPVPVPGNDECKVIVNDGANPWWAGFNVGANAGSVTLDFANTGIDLSRVTVSPWAFNIAQNGQKLTLTAPYWLSLDNPGYFDMYADNYAALVNAPAPTCTTPQVAPPPPPPPVAPDNGNCRVTIRPGNNPWWVGLGIATNEETITLDFSNSGIDLSRATLKPWGFLDMRRHGQTVTVTKRDYVNLNKAGFFDLTTDQALLSSMTPPICLY